MSEAILPKQDKTIFEFFGKLYDQFVLPVEESLNEQIAVEDSQLATLEEYVSESCAIEQRDKLARFLEQLDAEEKIHRARAQAEERKARLATRIREAMMGAMSNLMANKSVKRINGETYSFIRAKMPVSVEILDEASIPREACPKCGCMVSRFFDIEYKVSRQRIGDALRAGEEVPGCRLSGERFNLRVL